MIINCYALPRSGHNAILNFILSSNNCDDLFSEDKEYLDRHYRGYGWTEYKNLIYITVLNDLGRNIKFAEGHKNIINSTKKHIVFNYELGKVKPPYMEGIDILVLRDCYNNFASMENSNGNYHRGYPNIKETWKNHAEHYLNNKNITKIKYNSWLTDVKYRQSITDKLELPYCSSVGFNAISPFGGGSSFDENDKNYLRRYESVKHGRYWGIFDQEMVDLNRKIFGMYAPEKLHYMNPWYYKLYKKSSRILNIARAYIADEEPDV